MSFSTIDQPVKALAVIMEDELDAYNAISSDLDSDGRVRHVLANDFADFYRVIKDKQQRVCVASIDWYIDDGNSPKKLGRKAVQLVKREQPWAATIVYTNDDNLQN